MSLSPVLISASNAVWICEQRLGDPAVVGGWHQDLSAELGDVRESMRA
jgi:hypothetical protein